MKQYLKMLVITCVLIVSFFAIMFCFFEYQNAYKTGYVSRTKTDGNFIGKGLTIEIKGLPKTFSRYKNYVTVESINYVCEDAFYGKVIKTYWSGVAGSSYKGSNYSIERAVGYKLYDPTGLVIASGTFATKSALKENERFKDDLEEIKFYQEDFSKLNQPGTYVLELMDSD